MASHALATDSSAPHGTSSNSHPQPAEPDISIALLEAVKKDAAAVAQSLAKVSAGLRSSLSEITLNTISHMECHRDAAGHLQEASLEAASRGNKFVNECLRLNEEMKGAAEVATKIKQLRKVVDQLETQANRYLQQ